MRRIVLPVLLLAFAGCIGAGMKNYRKAEKLRSAGSLVEARAEYKAALAANPNKQQFKDALSGLESDVDERVADHKAEAKKEKRGDEEEEEDEGPSPVQALRECVPGVLE